MLSRYNKGKYCYAHDNPRDAESISDYRMRVDKEIRRDKSR